MCLPRLSPARLAAGMVKMIEVSFAVVFTFMVAMAVPILVFIIAEVRRVLACKPVSSELWLVPASRKGLALSVELLLGVA